MVSASPGGNWYTMVSEAVTLYTEKIPGTKFTIARTGVQSKIQGDLQLVMQILVRYILQTYMKSITVPVQQKAGNPLMTHR